MANLKVRKLEAHDAAGYETEMLDWSSYDDGYGNNLMQGDRSVQRLVEAGIRDWGVDSVLSGDPAEPVGYDTEPFQSQAQRRFMHAKHPEIAERWEKDTPKGKHLPEHK